MTKEFTKYVTAVLKENKIEENEEFITSDNDFGVLNWCNSVMHKEDGSRLTVGEITWILEETDIKKRSKLKKIVFGEAVYEMKAKNKKIYIELEKDEIYPVEIYLVRDEKGAESEKIIISDPVNKNNPFKLAELISAVTENQFYKQV